jgi:hypothetical protein
MTEFLKENAIFVVSSIIFIGLFAIVSEPLKTPSQNQVVVDQTNSVNTKIAAQEVSNPAPAPTVNTQTPKRLQNNRDDSQYERNDD